MSDRGSCKVFSPNIFNPTKCQNCYKPKEGHPTSTQTSQTGKLQRGLSLSVSRERNTAVKTVLKEGYLWIGLQENEIVTKLENWEKRWFVLYSSGELESFPVENDEVLKSESKGITVLQDFVRMLDGSNEIGMENSLGLKSLKDSIYLKTVNKIDFENWWKELSNFVPSPMKRAYSASAATRPQLGNSKMWLSKTNSSPRASSPKTTSQQNDTDNPQVVSLNSKISKLQQETKRIPKLEEEKRKLELEVNYWKEYVTSTSSSKKSGSKIDSDKELNEARNKMINLQDQLNEAEKGLEVASAKGLAQGKELEELKGQVDEGNKLISLHKATINGLNNELSALKRKEEDAVGAPQPKQEGKQLNAIAEERIVNQSTDSSSERGETGDIESKFLTLREKMKRIEKELFLKSKELEKANESRSKVAKYTRTLLQELEAKLNDTQRKYVEGNEKYNNLIIELEMERERRKRLESEKDISNSRSSSISSTMSYQEQNTNALTMNDSSPTSDRSENEISNRYVDYYRSRFRETEAALLDKDKKLSSCESKIKELETRYKTVVKQCKSLDDIQVKLSDATHKLSDRQLKIHELTREVEKLRGYERSYERRSKELETSKENLKNSDAQLSEMKRKLSSQEKDLEMFKIREVVMKERLSALEEESSDESGDDDDDDSDKDEARLEKSIETQKRVESIIDLEGKLRLLSAENEELKSKQIKLESQVSQATHKSKEVKDVNEADDNDNVDGLKKEKEKFEQKISELEEKIIVEEEKLCKSMSELKEKHKSEIALLKTNNKHENSEFIKLKEDNAKLKERCEKLDKEELSMKNEESLRNFAKLEEEIVTLKAVINEKEGSVSLKNEKITELEKTSKQINDDLNEKTQELMDLNDLLEQKNTQLKLQNDKIEYLDKICNERSSCLNNMENENKILREQINTLEKKPYLGKEDKHEAIERVENDEKQPEEGSESNEKLWNDLKNMRVALQRSQSTTQEIRIEMEDVGKKYLESEQKVIELAKELDNRLGLESDMNQWAASVEAKLEAVEKQVAESRDLMQTKVDYLEKERNNVIHLVNVTSAYICELENSLTESRNKIEELQSIIEHTRGVHGKRIPPEGRSDHKDESSSDQSDVEDSSSKNSDNPVQSNVVNQELVSKITKLESEINEVKATYENEKNALLKAHQLEMEALERKMQQSDFAISTGVQENPKEEIPAGYDKGEIAENATKIANFDQLGSTADNLHFLNRIQELEVELEETRQKCNAEIKLKAEQHKNEIDNMKDDMAKVLQASITTNFGPSDSQSEEKVRKLEEKLKQMEHEMEEMEIKYEEEIEMEREAHQYEMEETIRDMLTVKDALTSGKYSERNDSEDNDETGSQRSNSRRSSVASTEGIEEIKRDFNKKLAAKEREYLITIDSMKKDMSGAIEAVQHGGASTAILELTNKNQALKKEVDEIVARFDMEREDYKVKIEKLESGNFFGLRRNEEMGTKIYQMQIELEELERKHKLELEAYKNKDDSTAVNELVKINENFEKKIRRLEDELVTSKENSIKEMEMMTMKVHEEKRKAVGEMTDTVLSLEAIIDEMKESHDDDVREFEERSQEEKIESISQWKLKVEELESLLADCNKDFDERFLAQEDEHSKEMKQLEEAYDSKVESYKTLLEENRNKMITADVSELQRVNEELNRQLKEEKSKLQSTIDGMQKDFIEQSETKQKDFDNQIAEIRSEYEEKLKSCIKESTRRHSVTSRKTESQRIKELTGKVEELETTFDQEKTNHESEVNNYRNMVSRLQSLIKELRSGDSMVDGCTVLDGNNDVQMAPRGDENAATRVNELEEQISRYEKRIDYYQQKQTDTNEVDETMRIAELQHDVEGLKKEMQHLTESHETEEPITSPEAKPVVRRRRSDQASNENPSNAKQMYKRWSDLHLTDVVFTNDGMEQRRGPKERDARKRWSDLQLKQDNIVHRIGELGDKRNPKLITQLKKDEVAKSGSIARRKKLWESFSTDDSKPRPLSSIRP